MRRYLALIVLMAVFAMGGVLAGDARAVESGDVISFLVSATDTQPDLANDPRDKLIFTGGPVQAIDTTGCSFGSHPLQNVVFVDPGSREAARLTEVIIVSQTDPVPPGTKLQLISLDSGCLIPATGTLYFRYNGVVK